MGFSLDSAWINWLVLGFVLLGLEMFTGTFVVLFFAVSAMLTAGLVWLCGIESVPVQVVIFAVCGGAALFLFRGKLRIGFQSKAQELRLDIGTSVAIEDDVAPGGQTEVQYQGTRWLAVNESGRILMKGTRTKVSRVDGNKLLLQ